VTEWPPSFASANGGEQERRSVPEPSQGGSEVLACGSGKCRLEPVPSSHRYNPVLLLAPKVRDR